ncbi:ABC transporter substrate-binding protein [Marinomonas rhizomae]|uniref:Peptide/nickel transport system substrate-binding protein n=1 Tax=Marinomonas rhizomae TaxID=491948 RepID=A0A366IZS5_9GAMM|nr:ABC transporter substrate-binding protein [Marinomonas rhizomae]RBP79569.1 peptide/nickel transport system substrate-binding protein [Marinomonas rhizomae]
MKYVKKWPWMALALSVTALTGCFDGTEDANEQTSTSSATQGDRIKLAMLLTPRTGLSPLSDDAFKFSRWSVGETLVFLDKAGNLQPSLATEWEQLTPNDWRFTLRDGVMFHDGTQLTPNAVANALRTAANASPKPRILDGVSWTVKTDGDNAVIVSSTEPDPLLAQRLTSPQLTILAPSAYAENGTIDPENTGTGPFRLVKLNGSSTATIDRFDGYWGEKAQAPGIDVSFVPDGIARASALRSGEADIVEAIPVSQAPLLDPDMIREVPMPRTNTLYLNTQNGVMTNPGMRAAVRDAINRKQLVDNVYESRADIGEGLLGPALPWAAKLRQPVADPVMPAEPNGVTITLGTYTDRTELPEVAVYLAQQLTDAGFTVKQDVREYSQIESDALAGKFDAFILSRATMLDLGDPVAYMSSDFTCNGSYNLAQLCDPAIDQALQTASALPAGEARQKAIMKAENLILATDAAIPMLHERVIQGQSKRVRDAIADPRERLIISTRTHLASPEMME